MNSSAILDGSSGKFVANQPARLPSCDCDVYMPLGQHDPYQHAAQERAAIEDANAAKQIAAQEAVAAKLAASRCSCRASMPPGQHDPMNHKSADRAAISEANEIVAAADARHADGDSGKHALDQLWKVRGKWAEEMRHSAEVRSLTETLKAESQRSHFTCGGSTPLAPYNGKGKSNACESEPHEVSDWALQQGSAKSISVRWGSDGNGRILTLPQEDIVGCLDQLVRDCAPATFGKDGKDVNDESYRRAGALSAQKFMTDFCPYEAGIIDVITRLLLPPVKDASAMFSARGIRAELYKLNVYSGPSGFFRPHVDTPRSSEQVGSLVVCLPVAFQGGALAVRHKGYEVIHSWANEQLGKRSAVQWAAFCSDCEHEVLEVTAGHRITLTYNLFMTAQPSPQGEGASTFQPESMPLTRQLKVVMDTPTMWPHGGYIGVHMAHSYPHTHKMLKGTDMAVYAAVTAPSLPGLLTSADPDDLHSVLEILDSLHSARRNTTSADTTIHNLLRSLEIVDHLDEDNEEVSEDYDPISASSDSDEDFESGDWDESLVERFIEKQEAMRADRQICWLNEPGHRELSKAFLAYGNEASMGLQYSTVALIVQIPTWQERSAMKLGSKEEPMVLDD